MLALFSHHLNGSFTMWWNTISNFRASLVINYSAIGEPKIRVQSTARPAEGSSREESSGIWSMLEIFTIQSEVECFACLDISRCTTIAQASRVSISETYESLINTHAIKFAAARFYIPPAIPFIGKIHSTFHLCKNSLRYGNIRYRSTKSRESTLLVISETICSSNLSQESRT